MILKQWSHPPSSFSHSVSYLQNFRSHVNSGPTKCVGVVLSHRVLAEHPGYPKVCYLPVDEPSLGVPPTQDVVRLKISVYDWGALTVQVLNGIDQLT